MYTIFTYIASKMYRNPFEDAGFNNWAKCSLANLLILNLLHYHKWHRETVKINLQSIRFFELIPQHIYV